MCERVGEIEHTLGGVIDALDAVDPSALSDAELHGLVTDLQRETSRLSAVGARHLAAWDARRTWADDGSKSAPARLARECDLSPMTARAELRRARKLRTMPRTAAAVAEGKVSMDQADLLAYVNQPDVAHLFERDEQLLLDNLKTLRFSEAMRFVKYWLHAAHDEIGKTPSSCRHDGRHFTAVRTIFDSVDMQGSLDVIGGTEFLSELQRLDQELFEADWAEAREKHGRDATPEQLARTAPHRSAEPTPWWRWPVDLGPCPRGPVPRAR